MDDGRRSTSKMVNLDFLLLDHYFVIRDYLHFYCMRWTSLAKACLWETQMRVGLGPTCIYMTDGRCGIIDVFM